MVKRVDAIGSRAKNVVCSGGLCAVFRERDDHLIDMEPERNVWSTREGRLRTYDANKPNARAVDHVTC